MKKIILVAFALLATGFAKADPVPASPLGEQVTTALAEHATFAVEYRHGSKNLILSDNVIEFGRLKGDYLFSGDLGLNGATLPGQSQNAIQFTTGLRFNVSTIVRNFVTLKPEWTFLNHFEYYGRGFYNWSDKTWRGSLNLGYGFGPGTAQ